VADYDVYIKPSALKELDAISSKKARQRMVQTIRALAEDPRPGGSRKLSGKDKYRIRCGDYRIVYAVQDAEMSLTVVKLGHRREVYRWSQRPRSRGRRSP